VTKEFYRHSYRAGAKKVSGVEREQAVRLYCIQHAEAWSLQVRGPEHLANGREGKAFFVATANLLVDDLRALRDAIDEHLREIEP
jgi:hypothetical protein